MPRKTKTTPGDPVVEKIVKKLYGDPGDPVEKIDDETPANNAEPGVVDDPNAGLRQDYADSKTAATMEAIKKFETKLKRQYIELPGPPEREISNMAETFAASGYFGDLTPAQIAVHIIAGRSLGLDDAQSVFDLVIAPGPSIAYRPAKPYMDAADAINERYDAVRAVLDDDDRTTPETASKARGGDVRQFPQPDLQIIDTVAGKMPVPPDNATVFAEDGQKTAHLANKGPSLAPEPENAQPDPPDPERPADVQGDAMATAISETQPTPEPDPAGTPETASSSSDAIAAAEAIGDAGPETVAAWRAGIVEMCDELGIDSVEKGKEFDDKTLPDKRNMFVDCYEYYSRKREGFRQAVMEALAADGKQTVEQMKGFFIYAGVQLSPERWSYTEAKKAAAALSDFMVNKPAA